MFLCDGDELYPTKYLRFIAEHPMPEDAPCGFTVGVECCELPNGEIWLYAAHKSRDAVFSVDTKWHGVYPFEGHDSFARCPEKNYYWQSPDPSYRFYHLHNTRRSSRDEDAYLRVQKKGLFSMVDRPDLKPVELWLKRECEYRDESL